MVFAAELWVLVHDRGLDGRVHVIISVSISLLVPPFTSDASDIYDDSPAAARSPQSQPRFIRTVTLDFVNSQVIVMRTRLYMPTRIDASKSPTLYDAG